MHWQGKESNSPNDVVLRSDDTAFFTDPTLRLDARVRARAGAGAGCPRRLSRVTRWHAAARGARLRSAERFVPLTRRKDLDVNDTTRAHVRAFDVGPDGSSSGSRIFANHIGTGTTTKAWSTA